ncbi:MAG: diguanylate cyclase [bacterium]
MTNEINTLQKQLKVLQKKFIEIENANKKLKQRLAQVDALYSITSTLGAIMKFEELNTFVKSIFTQLFQMEQFSLMIIEKNSNSLSIKSFHGLPIEWTKTNNFLKTDSIFRQAIETKKSIYIKNTSKDKINLILHPGIEKEKGSFLSLPLICNSDTVLGVLNLYRKGANAFDSQDVEMFNKISEQLAFTLNNILLYEHTKELSITDELTGIFNRRYFNQRFERELQRSKRYHHTLSVIMLDIDHFKIYNDLNGHIMGDEVLKKIAFILESNLRKADILARFGGEEFVILLPEISKNQSKKVANKLRRKIENTPFDNEESQPQGKITISSGLAVYPEDSANPQKLIQYADEALFTAKSLGRNCVVWHGMNVSSTKNLNLKNQNEKEIAEKSL